MEKYRFLPFAAKVLRVAAWIVLVVGVISSIVYGISAGNATGVAADGVVSFFIAVVGIIFSFLAWVFLLTTRELLYLFMDVEKNTRNTAEGITITEKADRD